MRLNMSSRFRTQRLNFSGSMKRWRVRIGNAHAPRKIRLQSILVSGVDRKSSFFSTVNSFKITPRHTTRLADCCKAASDQQQSLRYLGQKQLPHFVFTPNTGTSGDLAVFCRPSRFRWRSSNIERFRYLQRPRACPPAFTPPVRFWCLPGLHATGAVGDASLWWGACRRSSKLSGAISLHRLAPLRRGFFCVRWELLHHYRRGKKIKILHDRAAAACRLDQPSSGSSSPSGSSGVLLLVLGRHRRRSDLLDQRVVDAI